MIYIFMVAMLCCGYYTFTFGMSQWKRKNRLGGISTMAAAIIGTLVPIAVMYLKNI